MNVAKNIVLVLCLLSMAACKNTPKGDAETNEDPSTTTVETNGPTGVYNVQSQNSMIMWEGSKPGKNHNGTIKVSEGKVNVENGTIKDGSFVIDMNSISVSDLEGEWKQKLEAHLKGTEEGKTDDFFNVAAHPSGTFNVTKSTKLENDSDANTLIYGDLTIKGITKPVSFKAMVDYTDNKFTAHVPKFNIDRTEWNIKFMSKKFFDDLKDEFISDDIGLSVVLVGDPR